MKGTLHHNNNRGWYISYNEGTNNHYLVDVRPGRIDDLNHVGTFLKPDTEVDFILEDVYEFPYRYAVPYIETKETPELEKILKKRKEQLKITLWLTGFYSDEVEIICDGYDTNSNGYWYFYTQDSNRGREYLGAYPIGRTAIHKIEKVETEI